MYKHAIINGMYRYLLFRRWGLDNDPMLGFIMLNPSTADAELDDPTIRRCMAFGKSLGFANLQGDGIF